MGNKKKITEVISKQELGLTYQKQGFTYQKKRI